MGTGVISLGRAITITAQLTGIGKNKLFYRVSATDAQATILRGEHARGLVPRQSFLDQLAARPASPQRCPHPNAQPAEQLRQ